MDGTGDALPWRTSSRSAQSNCVEVAVTDTAVHVRHSRHGSGTVITFTHDEWSAFLDGVRNGEFEV